MLVVFGGLPGTGKTTLARRTATVVRAVYLRVDSIEQALLASKPHLRDVGPSGYAIARALAIENLGTAGAVVVDCVNPLPVTREMWRTAAEEAKARLVEIEIVCSDPDEHRRRVETRDADIAGHRLPTWQDVVSRDYAPWDRPPLRIDTAGRTPDDAYIALAIALERYVTGRSKGD